MSALDRHDIRIRWLGALLRAGKWRLRLDRRQRNTLITRTRTIALEYVRAKSMELDPQDVEIRLALSELQRFVGALLKPLSLRTAKALMLAARGMRYRSELAAGLTQELIFALRRSALRFPAHTELQERDPASIGRSAINEVTAALRVLETLLSMTREAAAGAEAASTSRMRSVIRAAKEQHDILAILHMWIADAEMLEADRIERRLARAAHHKAPVRYVSPGRSPPPTRDNPPFDVTLTSLWFLYSELDQSLPGTSVGGPKQPDQGGATGPFIRFIIAFLQLIKAEIAEEILRTNPGFARELDLSADAIRARIRRLGLTKRLRRGRPVTGCQLDWGGHCEERDGRHHL
jgi:hypothetical protein